MILYGHLAYAGAYGVAKRMDQPRELPPCHTSNFPWMKNSSLKSVTEVRSTESQHFSLSSPLLISSLTLSAEPSLGRSAVFQQAVHVLQGALAFTLDCLLAFIRWVWAERGRKHYNSISIPPVRSERVIPL